VGVKHEKAKPTGKQLNSRPISQKWYASNGMLTEDQRGNIFISYFLEWHTYIHISVVFYLEYNKQMVFFVEGSHNVSTPFDDDYWN